MARKENAAEVMAGGVPYRGVCPTEECALQFVLQRGMPYRGVCTTESYRGVCPTEKGVPYREGYALLRGVPYRGVCPTERGVLYRVPLSPDQQLGYRDEALS